jgi:hypothetical protein
MAAKTGSLLLFGHGMEQDAWIVLPGSGISFLSFSVLPIVSKAPDLTAMAAGKTSKAG